MTAQISNKFRFEGKDYTIAASTEPLRFDPREHGIIPEPCSTGCWNGFWCAYEVKEGEFLLETLYINAQGDTYPAINGVLPVTKEDGKDFTYMGHHVYSGLNFNTGYTGKLLVGNDFQYEFYVHGGYQSPWAYKILVELVFHHGRLTEVNDHSAIGAEIRKRLTEGLQPGQRPNRGLIRFLDDDPFAAVAKNLWWL